MGEKTSMSEMQFNKGKVKELFMGVGLTAIEKAKLLAEELKIKPEELFWIDDEEDPDSYIGFQGDYDKTYEVANGRLFDISGAPSEYFNSEQREYAKYLGNGEYEVDFIYYNGGTDFSELFGEYLQRQELGQTDTQKYFVKFREYNDNEGESWNFWLQLDGNESELQDLDKLINTAEMGGSESFSLDMKNPIHESEVDILVKHTEGGYMNDHNKVTGTFKCPDIKINPEWEEIPDEFFEELDDTFYKGDIARHFKEEIVS